MLRFYYVIIISIPLIIYYIVKIRMIMRNPEKYSEEYKYGIARNMARKVMRNSRIKTLFFGTENLPKDTGYLMVSNHQGKFDALGIIYSHDEPCSVVIDKKTAKMVLTNEFIMVLDGIRLDKEDIRQQLSCIKRLSEEVKSGKHFLIFPEGGYDNNKNTLQEFMPGAFKAALWSKKPIVPIALIDSYKPFGINSLKKVTTQVHYLKPIYYDEYKSMKTGELADYVKGLIEEKINSVLSEPA